MVVGGAIVLVAQALSNPAAAQISGSLASNATRVVSTALTHGSSDIIGAVGAIVTVLGVFLYLEYRKNKADKKKD